uniref:uncharacterized protein LOC122599240 n=1 Tax=Erigeron canadensis TaxID=72917 RepID=UPI001CB92673|nr:uncharacterized protein LOC122599240 [Erigeron canadensis]
MEECYFAGKLKRKQQINDDDFSLSSPATKIRRLDAELPPIIEEEEMVNPMVFEQPELYQDTFVEQAVRGSPIAIDELSGSFPVNEERAIVLYDPTNNMPALQTRSPFSVTVNSDFLSRIKNSNIWSKPDLLKLLSGKTEKLHVNSEQYNGSLAVVPWAPTSSQNRATLEVEIPQTEVSEMMDADDMEATTMDTEDNNSQQMPMNETGSASGSEGVHEWQQHCMIPQPPHNLPVPIAWSGTFYS